MALSSMALSSMALSSDSTIDSGTIRIQGVVVSAAGFDWAVPPAALLAPAELLPPGGGVLLHPFIFFVLVRQVLYAPQWVHFSPTTWNFTVDSCKKCTV